MENSLWKVVWERWMVSVGDNVQNHPRDGIRPPAAGERGAAAAACPAQLGS